MNTENITKQELTDEQKANRIIARRGHDENEEYAVVNNGIAYIGDILLDKADNDKETHITGFFDSEVGVRMASFSWGEPIASGGGPMYKEMELKYPATSTKKDK